MKIKYGTMGIVAILVYYTIKFYSKVSEAISSLQEPLSTKDSIIIAIVILLPLAILISFNDK